MSSSIPQNITSNATEFSVASRDVQQNLQRLDRLANVGFFSAGIAHEIKNGLVAINTFCEILLEKESDREMAGMVRRELKRIDGLVTQMLRLAALKTPAVTPVNVHNLLDLTIRLLEHQMGERTITLTRDYRAGPPIVCGDESRLQQVFLNLLLNAVEAMGQGGQLTVATEIADGRLRVSIADTGAGIAPENFSHIFDAFFTTKKNGTGLGLAISRHTIEQHHGVIEVDSKLGSGSTFRVILPAK